MSAMMLHTLLAGGAGLVVWVCTLLLLRTGGQRRRARLRAVLSPAVEDRSYASIAAEDVLAAQVAAIPFHRRILRPIWRRVARMALRYAPTRIITTLQRQLDAAGNPRSVAPHELLVAKAIAACLGLGAGLLGSGSVFGDVGPVRAALLVAASTAAGFFVPDLWVRRCRQRHLKGIKSNLPDVVDLLRVSMEGGLSYEGAVSYVVAKMQNPLTYELKRYLIDRQVGRGQDESMQALANRTREPDLMRLCEVVIQGEALGTGINRALTAFSADMRMKRRQRAEKKAHEAAMKMLFPMILLIFPAIFIIILGPVVPIIMHSFGIKA
jgi:tight adherence protein C